MPVSTVTHSHQLQDQCPHSLLAARKAGLIPGIKTDMTPGEGSTKDSGTVPSAPWYSVRQGTNSWVLDLYQRSAEKQRTPDEGGPSKRVSSIICGVDYFPLPRPASFVGAGLCTCQGQQHHLWEWTIFPAGPAASFVNELFSQPVSSIICGSGLFSLPGPAASFVGADYFSQPGANGSHLWEWTIFSLPGPAASFVGANYFLNQGQQYHLWEWTIFPCQDQQHHLWEWTIFSTRASNINHFNFLLNKSSR
ncbi:hypothetical protein TNIN_308041 [Trichonephila inaurata madagascariensis]|uniref:Uncharacterized protein n=1 Tax=Trichonephila inaurata madagascariensis TaxID=2747483 RepID=A0A8X7BPQ2_9ARAC|nr:hypothetical protein TNIN_308041 [Trichonephila inaurata madagascariensis]